LEGVIEKALIGEGSLTALYRKLEAVGAAEAVKLIAAGVALALKRALAVYRAALEKVQRSECFEKTRRIVREFTKEFDLGTWEISPFTSKLDPVHENYLCE
jgi:hypothetical protein